MKKIILILITLTAFTNVSYASFPIIDTLEIKQDTVKTETVAEYHLRMQKMGFDIDDCRCERCISKNVNFMKVNNEMPFIASVFSFEAGLGTIHAPNLLNLNYEYHFDKKFSWHFSVGLPSFTTGFTLSNEKNSQYSLILGKIIGDAWCIRYAWVKEHSITEKLFWYYGVSVPIIMFDYGIRVDDSDNEYTRWEVSSLMSTAGSEDAMLFIPLPIVNIKYKL